MNMVLNLSEYISPHEAAEMLGIKYATCWARIKSGKIDTVQVGRSHLIKKTDIESMLNDNPENLG